MEPRELALHACRKIHNKGGEAIRLLEVTGYGTVFDFVVLANGRSERQVKTLVDEVYHFCKRHQIAHMPAEGEAGWRLIDCYEVIVHAFTEELREYYALDTLWPNPPEVDWEAELADLPDPDDALEQGA